MTGTQARPAGALTGATALTSAVRQLAVAAHRLDRCRTLAEVAEVAATHAREVLDARACAICRIEQDTCSVLATNPDAPDQMLAAGSTFRAEDRPALRKLLRDRASWVAHSPEFVSDLEVGDEVEADSLRAFGLSSGLAAPIIVNEFVWGQVYAARGVDQALFEIDDVATAEVLAGLIAGAVARVDLEDQVRHLVSDDPLTGLGNRRVADHAAQAALDAEGETCIVMCDVDGLKRVNDELGHDAGDDLLRAVADVLRRIQDDLPGSTAARLGGDEFSLVTGGHARATVSQAVARALATYPLPHGAAISWGIASTADGHADGTRTLFRRADAAQYQAKRSRARAAKALERRNAESAVTVDRLITAVVAAVLAAQTGEVTRLCALAGAAAAALGGSTWTVLRDTDGMPAAVARGGTPSDEPGDRQTLTVEHAPWVVQVETTAPDDATDSLTEALQALIDVAIHGAR
ncbi:sensor domain-containing diguanylate cyclase [Cellulomonas cellasea]|uniref:GGDEF domain-containing protein n=1 Tax=Cellulomonas cellasea TaxID=43670 RepID=UPI0025A4C920|nr:sensor domain-containing diguanylate cyclase [Cellulomonas cellasea]MDM8085870.1 sensor domain-containing diguanylate cyclase [Cellulomonas cellasea]